MSIRDIVLALTVVAVWGANFTAIKLGLGEVPPMLLAALRYVAVALPAIIFVPRPKISINYVVAYGFTVGVGQFAALFYGLYLGMPAGLSSVVLQSQAFLTPMFAYWALHERTSWRQWAGMGVAGLGLLLIAMNRDRTDAALPDAAQIPPAAILLTLVAASFWALSNIVVRRAVQEAAIRNETINMPGLVVWSALIPPIPLFALALGFHGPQAIARAFLNMGATSMYAIAFIAYGATIFGYSVWSRLLATYPTSTVAPFSLLVPVTGLLTSGLVLAERLTLMQWLGSAFVAAGLLITLGFGGFRRGSHGRRVRGETLS